ncbi:MAG: pseudouridine synthase [Succinivibrio sp.]
MKDFVYNPPKTPYLDILYQDEFLVVVNKPSGLLSVPGRLAENHDSIISRIKSLYPETMASHRLDMDTSGLMVVGLKKEIVSALNREFEKKEVSKLYYALVEGNIDPKGRIDLPIRCDLENRPLQIVDHLQGKPSITLYERVCDYTLNSKIVKADKNEISLVRLTPVTGRSHQLRVHLKSIGHPILGDRFYAPLNTLEKASRLCLHAYYLEFMHPITNTRMKFESNAEFLN